MVQNVIFCLILKDEEGYMLWDRRAKYIHLIMNKSLGLSEQKMKMVTNETIKTDRTKLKSLSNDLLMETFDTTYSESSNQTPPLPNTPPSNANRTNFVYTYTNGIPSRRPLTESHHWLFKEKGCTSIHTTKKGITMTPPSSPSNSESPKTTNPISCKTNEATQTPPSTPEPETPKITNQLTPLITTNAATKLASTKPANKTPPLGPSFKTIAATSTPQLEPSLTIATISISLPEPSLITYAATQTPPSTPTSHPALTPPSMPEPTINPNTNSSFLVEDSEYSNPNEQPPSQASPDPINRNNSYETDVKYNQTHLRALAVGQNDGTIVQDNINRICCGICRVVMLRAVYPEHCKSASHKKKARGWPRWWIVKKECDLCKWQTAHDNFENEYQEHINGNRHKRMTAWVRSGGLFT